MLSLALVASALTLGCSGTTGESSDPDTAGDAEERVETDAPEVSEHVERLRTELELSDEQTEQVAEIVAGSMTRMEEFRDRVHEAREAGDREQMKELHEEGRLLMEEQSDRMKAVLTPEQFAKYEALSAEHHGKHGMRHGGKGHHGKRMHEPKDPAEAAAKLAEKLGLSDEQKAQAEKIFAESHPQRQELHEKAKALHEEARALKESGDEEAMRAKKEQFKALKQEGKALHDAQAEKIKAILTDDQRAKFEEMMQRKHDKHRKHGEGHECDGSCEHHGKGGHKGDHGPGHH